MPCFRNCRVNHFLWLILGNEVFHLSICGVNSQFEGTLASPSSFLLEAIPVFSLVFEAGMRVGDRLLAVCF